MVVNITLKEKEKFIQIYKKYLNVAGKCDIIILSRDFELNYKDTHTFKFKKGETIPHMESKQELCRFRLLYDLYCGFVSSGQISVKDFEEKKEYKEIDIKKLEEFFNGSNNR